MSWIKTIGYEQSLGRLRKLYDRVRGPQGAIDHVLTVHSLRPHTLRGHLVLYKSVLHHVDNTLPKWYLETIGSYISQLNKCNYCLEHHKVGIEKNLGDSDRYILILQAMQSQNFDNVLDEKLAAGMNYAVKLTLDHASITEQDLIDLREVGLADGEILEINQVACYFNYVNRMVVGLGVNLEENNIGLSPKGSDTSNWSHS